MGEDEPAIISSTVCYGARHSEILRSIVKEASADGSEAGQLILDLASRYKGLRHPNRKEAPGFKAELRDIPGGAEIIGRHDEAFAVGQELLASVRAGWLDAMATDVGVERKLAR